MPKTLFQAPTLTSALLAEDLADREGLTGASRKHFLEFLTKSLGFDRPARPIGWRTLLAISVGTGLLGGGLLLLPGPGLPLPWFAVLWGGSALLGIGLSLGLRHAERQTPDTDRELNWRVYCLVLRPVVLAEKPGLLDRNLALDRSESERLEVRPTELCGAMFRERSADFWWSSVLGLWAGMAGLLVAYGCFGFSGHWIWAAPFVGMILGPVAWGFAQWFAWRLARRSPRIRLG